MSNQKDQQLERLWRVQQAREQAAGKKLEQAIGSRDRLSRKAGELQGYLRDYDQSLSTATDASGAGALANYRSFQHSMHQVVQRLALQEQQEDQRVSAIRDEWIGCRADKLALEKLLQRQQLDRQRILQKRQDQEISDRGGGPLP